MSEQRLLFDLPRAAWVDRIWQAVDDKRRRQIIAILAQMGRHALASKATLPGKEATDES